jgi:hypothetical protein
MDRKREQLGEILIHKRLIREEDLKAALKEQKRTREFLGKILLKNGYIKETDLLKALSEQLNISVFNLKDKYIDWHLLEQFSPSLVLDHRCIPIKKDDWSITVGVNNPMDAWVIKKAEEETVGLKLKLVLISEEDINEAIRRYKEYLKGNINRLF